MQSGRAPRVLRQASAVAVEAGEAPPGTLASVDAMVADGLWDPYGDCHMGSYAELCADTHAIERAAQDAHADESYRRARAGAARV